MILERKTIGIRNGSCPKVILLRIIINYADDEVVELLNLVVAHTGLYMTVAHSAIVSDEYIGTSGCDGEESQHELCILVNTAGSHGDQSDTHLGTGLDRLL